jgi:hypothetical protein
MELIEKQLRIGRYIVTLDCSSEDKCFDILTDGDVVIGNTYANETNIDELIECLQEVKKFLEE